jgi:Transmembrane domain of unknown function (DUF3566)
VKTPTVKAAAKTNGAVANTNGAAPKAKAAPKSTGNGSRRSGPVDPRTEDVNSPPALSRAGKTVWRRPGALTPRTAKHRETGAVDAPIDFAVALPLAPADTQLETEPIETVEAKSPDTVRDLVVDPAVVALAPTIEVLAPSAPIEPAPTELVPAMPLPTELRTLPVPLPAPILYDEAATIDDVTKIGPILETRPLRRPINFRRAPKPRIRRVTRVVRHVDTWSVFKVALVFSVFFYAVAMVAGVLLWQVAYATGTIDNVEKFFEGFGWESFDFNGGQIFHNAWIAGLFVAIGLTGLAVLLATLFNLITDLVGGVRFSVLEEEVRTRAERGTEPVVDLGVPVTVAEAVIDAVDDPDAPPVVPDLSDEAIAG